MNVRLRLQTISILASICGTGLWAALGCGAGNAALDAPLPKPFIPTAGRCPGALVGENVQLTFAVGESNFPQLVWDGSSYQIVWWDMRGRKPDLYTMKVDRDGLEVKPLHKLPNESAAKHHSIAFDGEETHIAWVEGDEIRHSRYRLGASKPKILAKTGSMPAAGPFGAAVWVHSGKLFFQSDGMTAAGADVAPVTVAMGGIQDPQIAYNGVFYAVVWSESAGAGRRIVMQRVSPKGEILGDTVAISAAQGMSKKPAIAWAGGHFAIAWTNAAPSAENQRERYRLFFAVIADGGSTPRFTRRLDFKGSADQVALAATGEEYALAWVGSRSNGGSAIFMQRLDLDGTPLERTIEVSDGVPLTCSRPDMVWTGDGYGVVWHDDRTQVESEIFFASVSCGKAVSKPTTETAEEPPHEETPANEMPESSAPSGAPQLKDVF